jgi:hypothetical protein
MSSVTLFDRVLTYPAALLVRVMRRRGAPDGQAAALWSRPPDAWDDAVLHSTRMSSRCSTTPVVPALTSYSPACVTPYVASAVVKPSNSS